MKSNFFAVSLVAVGLLAMTGCGKDEQPQGGPGASGASQSSASESTEQLVSESTPSARTSALGEKYSLEFKNQRKLKNNEKSQNIENGCKVAQEVREAISVIDRDGRVIDLLKSTESVEKLRGKKSISKSLSYVSARIMAFSKKLDQSCAKTKGVRGSKKAAFQLMQLVKKYKDALAPKSVPSKKKSTKPSAKISGQVSTVGHEDNSLKISAPGAAPKAIGHEDDSSGMSMPGPAQPKANDQAELNMSVDPRELMSR